MLYCLHHHIDIALSVTIILQVTYYLHHPISTNMSHVRTNTFIILKWQLPQYQLRPLFNPSQQHCNLSDHNHHVTYQKVKRKVWFYIGRIQSFGPLKALYTSSPFRPVHSDTNSPFLGRILATHQLCATTNRSHNHLSSTVYLQVLIYTAEWILRCVEIENSQSSKR